MLIFGSLPAGKEISGQGRINWNLLLIFLPGPASAERD